MTSEQLKALADGIEAKANKDLDEALENAARISDPVNGMCGTWALHGGDFALVAILRNRAAEAEVAEKRAADQRCYEDQLATANAAREREGKPPLSMSQFLAGGVDE